MNIFYKYKSYIIFVICLVILFSFVYFYNLLSMNEEIISDDITDVVTTTTKEIINGKIYVDVKGAVKKPGVYLLNDGDLVIDAIEKAGGLAKGAVTSNINLSKMVSNEMVIYVFTSKELTTTTTKPVTSTTRSSTTSTTKVTTTKPSTTTIPSIEIINPTTTVPVTTCPKCECEVIEINNCIPNDNEQGNDKINLNTATFEELCTLSGIGESKANAIIKYRDENGGFNTIEDIMNISGIGTSMFEKIKDSITV